MAGYHRESIQMIKQKIASLLEEPAALESFCVKSPNDLEDGAFLVPKVVLVATHCPGKKVLDDAGDEGQLDLLYDAVCDAGGKSHIKLTAHDFMIYSDLTEKCDEFEKRFRLPPPPGSKP